MTSNLPSQLPVSVQIYINRKIKQEKHNRYLFLKTFSSSLFSQTFCDLSIRHSLVDIRPPFSGCSLTVKFHHCFLVSGISSFSHTKFASTLEIFILISCTSILLVIIKELELLNFFKIFFNSSIILVSSLDER